LTTVTSDSWFCTPTGSWAGHKKGLTAKHAKMTAQN